MSAASMTASHGAAARQRRFNWRAIVADALIALVSVVPFFLTVHVPLADLPNHLARQFVLRDWASSPELQAYYQVHWALVPNLALELFVLAMRQVMPIALAVRLFCIVTIVLLLLGTRLINRQLSAGHGRIYRIAPLLCYGGPLQYGFLSYCFGIGLALLFFGFYLRLRDRTFGRLALWLVPAGCALILCHLVAFGVFALAVGGCELACAYAAAEHTLSSVAVAVIKHAVRPIACLVPVFLLMLLLSPTKGHVTGNNMILFSSLHQKARGLAAVTMFSWSRGEVALLALAAAGLGAAVAARAVRLHGLVIWIVALLGAVWLLLPNIAIGAAFIDYRMPWAISFFLLAGLVPGSRYGRLARWFGAWFTGLVVARIVIIAVLWLRWEPTLAAIDRALDSLPLGARLMVVQGPAPDGNVFRDPTLDSVSTYAVARRHIFDPGLFANIPGQLLDFQPDYAPLWVQDDQGRSLPTLDHLPADYDHVLVLVPETAKVSSSIPLVCQVSGREFALYKVVAAGAAPQAGPGEACGS